ncbi:MAG: hypothetical protein ACKVXR_12445 [Planctomycetota bacterium]
MNAVERQLVRLLGQLDSGGLEEACRDLDAGLKELPRPISRAERERILALHAALRAEVARQHGEAGRSLAFVVSARERLARLTRPEDARNVLDLDA